MTPDSLDAWVRALNAAIADKLRETAGSQTVLFFDADVVIDGVFVLRQIKTDYDESDKTDSDLKAIIERIASSHASVASAYWAMGYFGKACLLPPHVLEIDHYIQRNLPVPGVEELNRVLKLVDLHDLRDLLGAVDSGSWSPTRFGAEKTERLTGSTFVLLRALSGFGDGAAKIPFSTLLDLSYVNDTVEKEAAELIGETATSDLWTRIRMRQKPKKKKFLDLSRFWQRFQPPEIDDNPRNALSDAAALVQLARWMRNPENEKRQFRFFTNTKAVIDGATADLAWRATAKDRTLSPVDSIDDETALDDPNSLLRSGRYLIWRCLFPSLESPATKAQRESAQANGSRDNPIRFDWSLPDLKYLVHSYRDAKSKFSKAGLSTIYRSLSGHHKWLFSNLDDVRQSQFIATAWLQASGPLHVGLAQFAKDPKVDAEQKSILNEYLHGVETRENTLGSNLKSHLDMLTGHLRQVLQKFADLAGSLPPAAMEISPEGGHLFSRQTGMSRWLLMPPGKASQIALEARDVWIQVALSQKDPNAQKFVPTASSTKETQLAQMIACFAAGDSLTLSRMISSSIFDTTSTSSDEVELSIQIVSMAARCAFGVVNRGRELPNMQEFTHLETRVKEMFPDTALHQRATEAVGWIAFYLWVAMSVRSDSFRPIATDGAREFLLRVLNEIPVALGGRIESIPDICWLLAASSGDWRYPFPAIHEIDPNLNRHRLQAIAWYCVSHAISAAEPPERGTSEQRRNRADPWFEVQNLSPPAGITETYWTILADFYKKWPAPDPP